MLLKCHLLDFSHNMKTLLLLLAICGAFVTAEISDETKSLVEEWTPVFWLHSEEQYFPTNFDYYIENMELRDKDENVVQAQISAETLPGGPDTKDLHLNTFDDIECVNCVRPHFFGQTLDHVNLFTCFKEETLHFL